MSPRPITRIALAALLVAALPACSLLGGKKAPPTQYAPMPQVAAEASWPRVDAQLEIAPVQVARPYDTLRIAVRRWEQQLDWSHNDGERFSRIVLPALTELADERLRLRHGVSRASDPRRARELMGEPLWQVLHDPGRRPPKAREMSAVVDALEKI